jgi:PPM family protein phosphatase
MTDYEIEIAFLSEVGTERDHNEDCCGSFVESGACAILAVADGVSSYPGGEVASQMAIDVVLRAYREESPTLAAGHRLYRAVQQANIEVYDRAVAVPELRGMATTLTAVAVDRGELTAVHVGDSRLYLVRDGEIAQLTKDHTLAAEKVRFGLLGKERAQTHADRCVLTRSVGRELIVSRDRTTRRLLQSDVVVLCSDGLYNVISDDEIEELVADCDPRTACRRLVDAANERGTPDNVTVALLTMTGPIPDYPEPGGLTGKLRKLLGRP